MMKKWRVEVPGGVVFNADLFKHRAFPDFRVAIADPPYGDAIVDDEWDQIDAKELSERLIDLSKHLERCVDRDGAHLWIWGGIGTPGQRALYRTLIGLEDQTGWKMAEQITWKKKRGYGTDWRCLMNREECLRFVLGDPKKPSVYHKQLTEEVRGYAGFNKKYPAKSEFKRLTMVWDHASDMAQNKLHKCQKPEPLCRSQILSCSNEGDMVLDLFAASGEVSVTARNLGRRFVAYEKEAEQFEKLVARLRE